MFEIGPIQFFNLNEIEQIHICQPKWYIEIHKNCDNQNKDKVLCHNKIYRTVTPLGNKFSTQKFNEFQSYIAKHKLQEHV